MNTLKIVQDSCIDSPRNWDNLGTMAYKHSNYELGEEKISEPIEWLEEKLGVEEKGIYTNERLAELEAKFFDKFIALPLYLYDHSGQSISTSPFSCRWDSGKVGYIYVDKKTVLKEYGGKIVTAKLKERVLSYLQGEVETFNQYIQGDVYGYQIEDEDGNHIDSCYGFYGTDWATNGITDHIDFELLGLSSDEELVKLIEETEIEY